MSRTTLRPDVCVIGAGEAGRAVAMGATALGASTLVIDDGDPSGRRNPDLVLELLRQGARAGGDTAAIWAGLRTGTRRAAVERSHARLAAMNIRVIAATGRFRDRNTVEAGGQAVQARRFVIATGRATAARLREGDLAISDLPSLPARPERLVVSGAEPASVSVALSLARLGTTLTIAADRILPGFDPELVAPLLVKLRRAGVAIGDADAASPRLCVAHAPALAPLALEPAGIARHGTALALTRALRTTNQRVFAVGGAAGAASVAAGLSQAGVVLRAALLRLPARDWPTHVPEAIVTDPEIAQVGLTEDAARRYGAVQVWRWPLAQTGLGIVGPPETGHLKVVTDRRGRILGAGLVGPDAREMITVWTLAVARGMTLADLADLAVPIPSWSEAARGIAVSHTAHRLRHPWVRRAMGLLRRLG